MSPSQEHDDAVGAAPTAQEQLDVKCLELAQAEAALAAAELAYDIPRTVELQNTIGVLRKFITRLEAKAAVEAAAAAQEQAGALDATLRATYDNALAQLDPDIDVVRQAIGDLRRAVTKCAKTWNAAHRAKYEVEILAMRFALDGAPLAILPIPPTKAMHEAFADAVEGIEQLVRKQPLPLYSTSASDTPEQLAANRMIAAHAAVLALGKDMRLSPELLALFEKAGAPPKLNVSSNGSAAHIGTSPSVQAVFPGTLEAALVGMNPPALPETPRERQERDEVQRANTLRQAQVLREMGEEAQRIAQEDEAIRSGKLKRPLDSGMRG